MSYDETNKSTPELQRYQRLFWSPMGPPTAQRALLQCLVRFQLAGNDSRIFPSIETLANDTGLTTKTVGRHLAELAATGWIVRKLAGHRGQSWRRYGYELHWPRGFDPKSDKWLMDVKRRKAIARAVHRQENDWPLTEEDVELLKEEKLLDPESVSYYDYRAAQQDDSDHPF